MDSSIDPPQTTNVMDSHMTCNSQATNPAVENDTDDITESHEKVSSGDNEQKTEPPLEPDTDATNSDIKQNDKVDESCTDTVNPVVNDDDERDEETNMDLGQDTGSDVINHDDNTESDTSLVIDMPHSVEETQTDNTNESNNTETNHHQIAQAENDNNANMERELNGIPRHDQGNEALPNSENRPSDLDDMSDHVTSSHDISANKSHDRSENESHDTSANESHDTSVNKLHDISMSESHDTNVNESQDISMNDTSVNESHDTSVNESHDTTVNESHDTTVNESHDTTVNESHSKSVNESPDTSNIVSTKQASEATSSGARMGTNDHSYGQGKPAFDEMLYKIKLEPTDYEDTEEQYEIKDDEDFTLKPKKKKVPTATLR